jgi:hypothetical protein
VRNVLPNEIADSGFDLLGRSQVLRHVLGLIFLSFQNFGFTVVDGHAVFPVLVVATASLSHFVIEGRWRVAGRMTARELGTMGAAHTLA